MTDLLLTAAFGDYDHTRFLDRQVYPDGVDLRIVRLPPSDIFYRMCNYLEFDVSDRFSAKTSGHTVWPPTATPLKSWYCMLSSRG